MVFLWFSYGFPMVFLWFSYGFLPQHLVSTSKRRQGPADHQLWLHHAFCWGSSVSQGPAGLLNRNTKSFLWRFPKSWYRTWNHSFFFSRPWLKWLKLETTGDDWGYQHGLGPLQKWDFDPQVMPNSRNTWEMIYTCLGTSSSLLSSHC